jgi:hypothetical protein
MNDTTQQSLEEEIIALRDSVNFTDEQYTNLSKRYTMHLAAAMANSSHILSSHLLNKAFTGKPDYEIEVDFD